MNVFEEPQEIHSLPIILEKWKNTLHKSKNNYFY